MLPDCGVLPGQAPVQAASRPVAPTRVRMAVTEAVAMEVPRRRSRSVLLAKVRIQRPETKKSFVTMATGRM